MTTDPALVEAVARAILDATQKMIEMENPFFPVSPYIARAAIAAVRAWDAEAEMQRADEPPVVWPDAEWLDLMKLDDVTMPKPGATEPL